MSDDFAIATAAGRPVRIAGADYLIGQLTGCDLGDLQAYIKEQVPNPRLEAKELCRDLPDEVAKQIWIDLFEESKNWPPTVWSDEGNRILTQTREGAARVLWVLLRKHQPGFTIDHGRAMAKEIGFAQLNKLIDMGFPEDDVVPKSQAPTPTETTEDRGPVPA